MARRLPSQPPVLPGFSHVHILGSGGFADVFLYEQNMPRRQVAVKVLLSEVVNDHVRQMFQAEANLMAQLSSHPSILTVYQASVSSDGRPYLVMEMCSSALSERYRREPLPVAEVLRIAVKIGSAVETAHRAGVLHRDIKPSNILLTAYGHPVLSDFGIAATLVTADAEEAVGMSIPWSAPEVLLGENSGSVAAEVWSFAATVYSLLAGRSPFEVPGKSNKSADLIARIGRGRPQPIDRADVPHSLETALARAMSRNPEHRPRTILELVHELQAIESELGLAQTPIEVAMDDWALGTVSDLEDRTRVRALNSDASTSTGRPRRRRRRRAATAPESVVLENAQPSRSGSITQPASRSATALTWTLVVTAVLVLALAATAVYVLLRNNSSIPVVTDIEARERAGDVVFTWPDPGLREGDSYQIETSDGARSMQTNPAFVVAGDVGEEVCITVTVNRSGTTGSPSNQKCATVGQ
ncbi:serine/threonine protein kinase [Salinibacterium sp. SYSU T00001]|uniref:serine/threonine-protein kinase n=1 Tax=Homoserinimonas sedimenticola TaxID=2986805 RepID=UPI0022365686|nr:serine/threonine-protein kinase [Salinibacterium sedimenticola]MCW4386686.1 serine/threonine protein kinase [Salinibacterium sedimenticola]